MAEKSRTVATPCLAAAVMSPVPSTSKSGNTEARIQRNVAEKQRRDKLNGYISELANIVPMVSMSSKRLDKTSILRLSAAHLRICKSSLGGSRKQKKGFKWCPSFLSEDQVREILESVDGFLLVTTTTGKILFTSRSVERYLGHQDIDMIGHSLYTFIHPDDLDSVKDETAKVFLAAKENDPGPHRCSFHCRMREKGQPRSEVVTYQYVHFVGGVTASEEATDENASMSVVSHMFKAFVKVVDISPYNQLSLEEATADEYVTRHSLDGTIIFADHRLATITGHMPHEVVGLSAYAYIHSEDTAVALFAHHLMFSNDKGTGMIVYRLRTRNDKYVYLKSVGCLQFDAATSQVDHFVCVNQHLSDSDGDLQLKYFVDRFIPHIKGSSTSSLFESVKALQTSSIKSLSTSDRVTGTFNPKSISNRSPNVESDAVARSNSGMLNCPENGSKSSTLSKQKEYAVEKLKEGKQPGIAESKSKTSLSNEPMHGKSFNADTNHPPNSEAGFTGHKLHSGETRASEPVSSLQDSGTNLSYNISASDAEYFSKTIHRSTSDNVDTIYVSSLDSTLSIQKNNTHASTKTGSSHLVLDSLYVPKKRTNCIANQIDDVEVDGTTSADRQFGFSAESISEENSLNNGQFRKLQIGHCLEKEDSKMLKGGSFLHGQLENDISPHKEAFENSSLHRRDVCRVGETAVIDSNTSFPMEFMDSKEPINRDVNHITVNHSSFAESDSLNNAHLSLSLNNHHDSVVVLRNSMWPVKEIKEGISNSSMDICEDLQAVYGDANGEMKEGMAFQDDLSSLLNSTISQADSNSSLPSANGWNDVFNFAEYQSPLSSDALLPNEDEQLSINNPNVKSYDLW